MSASATSIRIAYQCFAPGVSPSGYACNVHVRALQTAAETGEFATDRRATFEECLRNSSFAPPHLGRADRSEQEFSDPVLTNILRALAEDINRQLSNATQYRVRVVRSGVISKHVDYVLASNRSQPEPVIWCDRLKAYVVASEAKAWEASVYGAHAQAFQASGDGALHLYRLGLDTNDCVVFGLVCAGGAIQVVANHLLPTHYPCFTLVSRAMSYTDLGERSTLVGYLCALADAAIGTVRRLVNATARPVADPYALAGELLFLKPVAAPRVDEDEVPSGSLQIAVASRLFDIFARLDRAGALGFACSPLGMVGLPPEKHRLREQLMRCLRHQGKLVLTNKVASGSLSFLLVLGRLLMHRGVVSALLSLPEICVGLFALWT